MFIVECAFRDAQRGERIELFYMPHYRRGYFGYRAGPGRIIRKCRPIPVGPPQCMKTRSDLSRGRVPLPRRQFGFFRGVLSEGMGRERVIQS